MNDYNNQNSNKNTPVNPYNYEKAEQHTASAPEANAHRTYQQPHVYDYSQYSAKNVSNEKNRSQALKSMIFGIVSLACCEIPFVSVIAIIFGALAKKWGSQLLLENPVNPTRTFARLGKIFGLIGFIVGIVMTVFWTFYLGFFFLVMIAAILASGV